MDRINKNNQRYSLDINISKTKFIVIGKNNVPNCCHQKIQQNIDNIKYKYLFTKINEQWDHLEEMQIGMGNTRAVFNHISKLSSLHYHVMAIKIRFIHWYGFSILFYGMESWRL